MLVHGVGAVEQFIEPLRAEIDHDRQTDRRPQAVAAANPVPEAEHVGGVDPELRDFRLVGRNGDEVLRDRRLVLHVVQQPGAGGSGVGQGFLGREGLGGDDEQGRAGIEPPHRLRDVGAVHVGDEMQVQVAVAIGLQRLRHHVRPQVGAADADVDDIGDAPPVMAFPGAVANGAGEAGHPLQHAAHVRHDIDAIDHDGPVGAVAQCGVEHRAVLRRVDLFPGEHAVAPALDILQAREVEQHPHGVGRDPVLGPVQQHAVQAQGEPVEPLGIVREQVAHVDRFHGLGMALQGLPFG